MKRRQTVFDVIREKARQGQSLNVEDFRLITREFFHRLQYDTEKQFVILNGFITPGMAKKHKVKAIAEDNGRAPAEYFESLENTPSLQELGPRLMELALIACWDHASYRYFGDKPKADPLFETATN